LSLSIIKHGNETCLFKSDQLPLPPQLSIISQLKKIPHVYQAVETFVTDWCVNLGLFQHIHVHQVTVKLSKWWLQLNHSEP
jgi:hypothetical protein